MYQYSLTWFLQLFHLALVGFRAKKPDEEESAEDSSKTSIEIG